MERLVKGEDDKVRSAIVRVHGDGRKGNTLKRPINKLYPLEVRSAENTTKLEVEDTLRANVAQQSTHKKESTRPKRRTAKRQMSSENNGLQMSTFKCDSK